MPRNPLPSRARNPLRMGRLRAGRGGPGDEMERAPCRLQRRPLACNEAAGYFLPAMARFVAARKRRFTSPQLMFRMKASR